MSHTKSQCSVFPYFYSLISILEFTGYQQHFCYNPEPWTAALVLHSFIPGVPAPWSYFPLQMSNNAFELKLWSESFNKNKHLKKPQTTPIKHQTSARSSKQLPARGWGLLSSVISTVSSISPRSFTVSSWMSEMLLNITSMSCKHKTGLSPAWGHLFGACKYWSFVWIRRKMERRQQKSKKKLNSMVAPLSTSSLAQFPRILPRSCCAPRTGWELDRHSWPPLLSLLLLLHRTQQEGGDFQEEFAAAPSSDPLKHRCS